MTDTELKNIILNKCYEKRNTRNIKLSSIDFNENISDRDISRICMFLIDDHFINAEKYYSENGMPNVLNINLTSKGVSYIEKTSMELRTNNTTNYQIINSSQFQIGDNNTINNK